MENVLVWNFSAAAARATIEFRGLPGKTKVERVKLDARAPPPDETSRLKFQEAATLSPGDNKRELVLESYGIELWFFKKQ
jgi:hypothetical protein